MVSIRCDKSALEYILGVLLEQPSIDPTDAATPSFRACFTEAGVACALDFISITPPSTYAGVVFRIIKDGTLKLK